MPRDIKIAFLEDLRKRYPSVKKLQGSQSLYEIGNGVARIYIRYSKVHSRNQAFFGLRKEDLKKLEGHPSILCFLWDGQSHPLLIPFSEYEEIFSSEAPAKDGQYKVMIYPQDSGTEFYIAKVGRFNVEGYFDWQHLENLIDSSQLLRMPDFSHNQIQTLLGSIGATKRYGIWIPQKDRLKLDWSITNPFSPLELLPYKFEAAERILQEIDVIWVNKASSEPIAFFEVEYSTPIYSGLLRLNDAYLIANNANSRFMVVSNDQRKELFVRQLNRPTFQTSRLSEICTFLDYKSVYIWHSNISKNSAEKSGENANEDS